MKIFFTLLLMCHFSLAAVLNSAAFNADAKSECQLFKKAEDFFGIKCNGVLHIGASIGEELDFYESRNLGKILYVEANPKVHEQLVERILQASKALDVRTFCFAASDEEKILDFYLTSNLKSSSILQMAEHRELYPLITNNGTISVQAKRVDSVLSQDDLKDVNAMVLDIQGAELKALKGCETLLNQIDFIITEVHFGELYHGSPRIESLDNLLHTKGFRRVDTISNARNWGDALYINLKLLEKK